MLSVCLSGYTIEGFLSDHPKNSHTGSWTQGAVNCHIFGNFGGPPHLAAILDLLILGSCIFFSKITTKKVCGRCLLSDGFVWTMSVFEWSDPPHRRPSWICSFWGHGAKKCIFFSKIKKKKCVDGVCCLMGLCVDLFFEWSDPPSGAAILDFEKKINFFFSKILFF